MTQHCDRKLVQELLNTANYNQMVDNLTVVQFDHLCAFADDWDTQRDVFEQEELYSIVESLITGKVQDPETGEFISLDDLAAKLDDQ